MIGTLGPSGCGDEVEKNCSVHELNDIYSAHKVTLLCPQSMALLFLSVCILILSISSASYSLWLLCQYSIELIDAGISSRRSVMTWT